MRMLQNLKCILLKADKSVSTHARQLPGQSTAVGIQIISQIGTVKRNSKFITAILPCFLLKISHNLTAQGLFAKNFRFLNQACIIVCQNRNDIAHQTSVGFIVIADIKQQSSKRKHQHLAVACSKIAYHTAVTQLAQVVFRKNIACAQIRNNSYFTPDILIDHLNSAFQDNT